MNTPRTHNYGLSGQNYAEYDNFLCGKRCRKRRSKRRAIRHERRSLKNDERRAKTERLRAETKLMMQTLAPSPIRKTAVAPQSISASHGSAGIQKAGFGGNKIMIAIAVLLLGGLLLQKNKQNTGAIATGGAGNPVSGTIK